MYVHLLFSTLVYLWLILPPPLPYIWQAIQWINFKGTSDWVYIIYKILLYLQNFAMATATGYSKISTLIMDKSIRKISAFPANKEFITESTTAHRLILSRECCIKSKPSNSVAYVLPENHRLTPFHNGIVSCGCTTAAALHIWCLHQLKTRHPVTTER